MLFPSFDYWNREPSVTAGILRLLRGTPPERRSAGVILFSCAFPPLAFLDCIDYIYSCRTGVNSFSCISGKQRGSSLSFLPFPLLRKMVRVIDYLAQQIASPHQGTPPGNNIWADAWGTVGAPVGIQQRSVQHVDLDNPALYLRFLTPGWGFAIFPNAARHPRAEIVSLKSKLDSRERMAHQVRDYYQEPNWKFANLIDTLSAAFWKVSRRVRCRRYPLYVTPSRAKDMFDPLHVVCRRRRTRNRWELVPPSGSLGNVYSNFHALWSVVSGNFDRDRRRELRANLLRFRRK